MSEKKQTAVMWLIEQQATMQNLLNGNLTLENYQRVKDEIINKALQMEREQKEYDYSCGVIHAIKNPDKIDCKQYYTDTYGE